MEAASLLEVEMASMLGAVGAGGNTGPHLYLAVRGNTCVQLSDAKLTPAEMDRAARPLAAPPFCIHYLTWRRLRVERVFEIANAIMALADRLIAIRDRLRCLG